MKPKTKVRLAKFYCIKLKYEPKEVDKHIIGSYVQLTPTKFFHIY